MSTKGSWRRRAGIVTALLVLALVPASAAAQPVPAGTQAGVRAEPGDPEKCADGGGGEGCEFVPSTGGEEGEVLDCKTPPEPEIPGEGMSGFVDPGPPLSRTPDVPRAQMLSHLYSTRGYAGLTWTTYDIGCAGGLGEPLAVLDTGLGNALMGLSTTLVALAVKLRSFALGDQITGPLDRAVSVATRAVHEAVFTPWVGLSLLLVAVVILWQARKREAHAAVTQVTWALVVLTAAAGVGQYPVAASSWADDTITTAVQSIDRSFAALAPAPSWQPKAKAPWKPLSGFGRAEDEVAKSLAPEAVKKHEKEREKPPKLQKGVKVVKPPKADDYGNLLLYTILYKGWLRGELGSDSSATASTYGPALYATQGLTWKESRVQGAPRGKIMDVRRKQFSETAEAVHRADRAAYGHLTGKTKGRTGSALTTFFATASASGFLIAADGIIGACRLLARAIAVLFPALAVIGLHWRTRHAVRGPAEAMGASVVNVPLFAAAGAANVVLVTQIAGGTLAGWLKVLVMAWMTYTMWKICRPLRHLTAMAPVREGWMGQSGGAPGMATAAGLYAATQGARLLRRGGSRAGRGGSSRPGTTTRRREEDHRPDHIPVQDPAPYEPHMPGGPADPRDPWPTPTRHPGGPPSPTGGSGGGVLAPRKPRGPAGGGGAGGRAQPSAAPDGDLLVLDGAPLPDDLELFQPPPRAQIPAPAPEGPDVPPARPRPPAGGTSVPPGTAREGTGAGPVPPPRASEGPSAPRTGPASPSSPAGPRVVEPTTVDGQEVYVLYSPDQGDHLYRDTPPRAPGSADDGTPGPAPDGDFHA
ncbi:hypothetical protein ACFY1V_31740 [Streptomyces sp. NPDC001255]|uniref:hypothetical protein n=1 Tax=Streptomyces sp. NPDC001255 TaxID=3364550 RepID=UPI0036C6C1F3